MATTGVSAVALVVELKERGVALSVCDGRLIADPGRLLSAADRERIAEHKVALVLLVLGRRVTDAHRLAWEACWSKRERFGDTPPDDPRPEARAASETCLSAHAAYMAALQDLHAAGGTES